MLATYKENSLLEVKSARGGLPNSLWESYSAFANSEGGVIVLGVKENSKDGSLYIEGLDDVHKLLKDFWNMVNNRQKVSCNILTDSMAVPDKLEGKDVIVIRVPRELGRPPRADLTSSREFSLYVASISRLKEEGVSISIACTYIMQIYENFLTYRLRRIRYLQI